MKPPEQRDLDVPKARGRVEPHARWMPWPKARWAPLAFVISARYQFGYREGQPDWLL